MNFVKAYICAFLILLVCLLPGSSLPTVGGDWVSFDKLVHFIMYVPMTWTLIYGFSFKTSTEPLPRRYLLISFIIACVYGAFIELLQFALTPDRFAELYDFFADMGGAAIGVLTYTIGLKLIHVWNSMMRGIMSVFKF